jgi:damage-control phosphatase, subfamily I
LWPEYDAGEVPRLMLLTPECIPCVLQASLKAIRLLTVDEEITKALAGRILDIPAMRGLDWSVTSPQVIESAWRMISETLGDDDPYRLMKERQTLRALDLYPDLRKHVAESRNPLETAISIAVMGNWIDVMWFAGSDDVGSLLSEIEKATFDRSSLHKLQEEIASSKTIVYLGDNAGEIAFDKLLIERIRDFHDVEIFFVVRSRPTLNDATLREAHMVGMQEVAIVLENGIDGPFPGTSLSRCSRETAELFASADLVISKGGGNFDSLHEERHLLKRIAFLLMSKCSPYVSHFGVPLKHPVIAMDSERDW